MIMKSAIQSFAFVLLAGLALAACSKHDDITPATWNGEIRLSSEITSQVKTSANNDVPDRQIAANQIVNFFVDNAGTDGTTQPLYANYLVKADGCGGFTKSESSAEDLYYPATGNNVDIYAFLTNGTIGNSFPASAILHSVASDQREPYGIGYLASDLLYAANKGVKNSNKTVSMCFYHLLSKVEVALKAGNRALDLNNAVVTIENTQLKADFLPNKQKNINDQTNGQSTRATMITPTTDNNLSAPIQIGTCIEMNSFSATTVYASAVVVPQTVAQDSIFIKVMLKSGKELYYTIPDANGLKLESGNKYQFQITVNNTGLTVQSTIADWTKEKPSDGTAEIHIPPIGSKNPRNAAIGDFYFSDGSLEGKDVQLTDDQRAVCIGIVYWVGDITADDPLLKSKFLDGTHGLVVALQDVSTSDIQWCSTSATVNNWTNSSDRGSEKVDISAKTKMQGYANTQALTAYNNQITGNLTVLPITAIAQYAANHPAPKNSSGWYWPSIMELKYMRWGQGSISGNAGKNMLNSQFEKVGGTNFLQTYFSSSESDNDSNGAAWCMKFESDVNQDMVSYGKGGANIVRSILAF
ncbi:MAG: fimbrillin family protein [Bacteroidaceae bacterium]